MCVVRGAGLARDVVRAMAGKEAADGAKVRISGCCGVEWMKCCLRRRGTLAWSVATFVADRMRGLYVLSAVATATRTPERGSVVLALGPWIVGVIWCNRIELLLRAPNAGTNGSRRDVCGPSVVLKRLWSAHM